MKTGRKKEKKKIDFKKLKRTFFAKTIQSTSLVEVKTRRKPIKTASKITDSFEGFRINDRHLV